MIWFLYWYMLITIVVGFLFNVSKASTYKTDNATKIGTLFGSLIALALSLTFLYYVYPLLHLVK